MRGSPDKELKRLVFFSLSIWVCSLTCPEGWHVFHSSSWHAALVHPGRGSRAGAGRGCPVVSAPPGWMPCPAAWRGSGYTTLPSPKEFIQGEVHKLNKKSENPDHSDSCVRHHSLRLAMTHARAQVQWSFWSFLTELVALNVSEPWWRNPKEGNTEKFGNLELRPDFYSYNQPLYPSAFWLWLFPLLLCLEVGRHPKEWSEGSVRFNLFILSNSVGAWTHSPGSSTSLSACLL